MSVIFLATIEQFLSVLGLNSMFKPLFNRLFPDFSGTGTRQTEFELSSLNLMGTLASRFCWLGY
jgi:hypothetical protein